MYFVEENGEPRGAQDVAKVDSVICDSGVGLLSIVNTKKCKSYHTFQKSLNLVII